MSVTTAEAGRALAERLNLTIVGTEGHDLKVSCPFCPSSDAARVHRDTGVFYCFRCQKTLNGFDLCKVVLNDHDQAKRLMVEAGLFEPSMGNGHDGNGDPATPADILDTIARKKGVTPAAFLAYGAEVNGQEVCFPMFGPDGEPCSTFTLSLGNGKGLYAAGKPVGLFLPQRLPKPGEQWAMVEGVKDAAALHGLGIMAAGLPTNRMNQKFAPMFQDVEAVIVPDADTAGAEGAEATARALWPVAGSVSVARLPVEHRDSKGADVRDVLKQFGDQGADVIRKAIADAKPVGADGKPGEKCIDFGLITAAELLRRDYPVEYLVSGVLAKGQHTLIGGPQKALKSLMALDLALSLARGGHFLGYFPVARPIRTIVMSGESGWRLLQDNIRRISLAAKATDSDLANMVVGVKLPKFIRPDHMRVLAETIQGVGPSPVVILDCAYLCVGAGDRASNVFSMGDLLEAVGEVFVEADATLVLLHHATKHIPVGEPLQLDNMAFAGFAEWAAQWLLLNPRTAHEPGSGRHELWLTIGARAGHGGLYGLDVDEGEFHEGQPRKWEVQITKPDEARQQAKHTREAHKAAEQERRDGEHRDKLLAVMRTVSEGETAKSLRELSGLNTANFGKAIASLLQEGRAERCEITKRGGKFDAFKPTGK